MAENVSGGLSLPAELGQDASEWLLKCFLFYTFTSHWRMHAVSKWIRHDSGCRLRLVRYTGNKNFFPLLPLPSSNCSNCSGNQFSSPLCVLQVEHPLHAFTTCMLHHLYVTPPVCYTTCMLHHLYVTPPVCYTTCHLLPVSKTYQTIDCAYSFSVTSCSHGVKSVFCWYIHVYLS